MIELLRRVRDVDPDRPAVVTHDGTATYGDLHAAAESIARALTESAISRIAVTDVEAAGVIPALAGASRVGTEACIYPPAEPAEITDLLARFDHHDCIAGSPDVDHLAKPLGAPSENASLPSDTPEERPHLVLTTGTTGTPRGVRHDWNRLLRGVERVEPAPEDRWLLAYGIHQFAGLQVLLHVAAAGSTLVAPTPRRPREGLRAIRELGVTHLSATPTYWRFLLAEMQSDGGGSPPLRQITLGGEAIPGTLLEKLGQVFPDARISQVYAASEFGSSGSVRDGQAGLPIDVIGRDEDAPVDMKVVDGQLWMRSRTGMLGYYGEESVDADGWRPTGDLVEVVGDRILFRGRTSEVINVGGVKIHPLPIENLVAGVPGVAICRVHGRPSPVTGSIVAVEVVLLPGHADADVRSAIRAACSELPAAARPRSITFVDSVTTVGNKVIRSTS